MAEKATINNAKSLTTMAQTFRKKDTLYTYFRTDVEDMPIEWDYTICETIEQAGEQLQFFEIHLDDPDLKAKVIITGIAMTPAEFAEWEETHELPDRLQPPLVYLNESPSTDQPVPEEVSGKVEEWEWALKSAIYTSLIGFADSNGRTIPCKEREQIEAEIIKKFKKKVAGPFAALQSRLSSTEAQRDEARNDAKVFQEWWKKAKADLEAMTEERDAIRKAFDLQAEELKKYRKQ